MIFTKPPGWSKPPIRYSMFVRSLLLFVSSIAKDNYTTLYFGCQYSGVRRPKHTIQFPVLQRSSSFVAPLQNTAGTWLAKPEISIEKPKS